MNDFICTDNERLLKVRLRWQKPLMESWTMKQLNILIFTIFKK